MARVHTAAAGDCVVNIARRYGFPDWQPIVDHPDNRELFKRRSGPFQLVPGDRVTVPDPVPSTFAAETGRRHNFVIKQRPVQVRITLVDPDGRALSGKRFEVEVDDRVVSGNTDSKGLIEAPISALAATGELRVWLNDPPTGDANCRVVLQLGRLLPLADADLSDEQRAIAAQVRLRNMGFYLGPVTGESDDQFGAALSAFQARVGLSQTGSLNQETIDRLVDEHDKK